MRLKILLRNLFRRQRTEQDLDEELRSYLALLTEEKIAAGMSPQQARRQAQIELGGREQVKEQVRDIRAGAWFDSLLLDLRYASRTLRKNPAFTAIAVLTLALGIGANTAMLALVNSLALPFPDAERLVHVWTTDATGELHSPSLAQYVALRKNSQSLEQVTATSWSDFFYGTDDSGWQTLPGLLVTSNWLPTLGVRPLLGRNFFDTEQTAGRDAVVILSYSC